MADGHLGYDMPIGGVAAYKNQVSVTGVGFDIACGNAAIRTDLSTEKFKKFIGLDLEPLALAIEDTISFGVGGTNKAADAPTNHPLFEDAAWAALPSSINIHNLKGKARSQLGTVGSGNHYVDVFSDEQDRIWVGVHFGSRGFGYTIAQAFIRMHAMQAVKRGRQGAALFDLDSPGGDAYWTLMNLAGKYAYAGREWVARKVVDLIGAKEEELVHNHHNFAWKETHFGQDLVVVRKGATPAFNFQKGFVGGSMGDNSVILRGMPSAASADALYSTVHGAGRVMSRTRGEGQGASGRPDEVVLRGQGDVRDDGRLAQ